MNKLIEKAFDMRTVKLDEIILMVLLGLWVLCTFLEKSHGEAVGDWDSWIHKW